jgi:3-hydroxy-3-methylglutaryl CoA synthase
MDCYINAMKQCYQLQKHKTQTQNIVQASDYLCFHTPFYKMIQKAFDALAKIDRPNALPEQIGC